MTDRSKLAKVMGRDPGMFAPNYDKPIFDPFNDANADYAVLVWMRKQKFWNSDRAMYYGGRPAWDYQVGDYARAALTLISQGGNNG